MPATLMEPVPVAGRVLARPSTSLAPRVVILGGGFAGVNAARSPQRWTRCASRPAGSSIRGSWWPPSPSPPRSRRKSWASRRRTSRGRKA